jgi:hypothetical protein
LLVLETLLEVLSDRDWERKRAESDEGGTDIVKREAMGLRKCNPPLIPCLSPQTLKNITIALVLNTCHRIRCLQAVVAFANDKRVKTELGSEYKMPFAPLPPQIEHEFM